ncbi:MAG: hypothetical protein ACEQSA_02080 [Weeksellaceae bacterium]
MNPPERRNHSLPEETHYVGLTVEDAIMRDLQDTVDTERQRQIDDVLNKPDLWIDPAAEITRLRALTDTQVADLGYARAFNNFHARFLPAKRLNYPGHEKNETYRSFVEEKLQEKLTGADHYHSPLFRSQTHQQWYDTLDTVFAETGRDLDTFIALHASRNDIEGGIVRLFEYILPTYIALRKMGYWPGDLSG